MKHVGVADLEQVRTWLAGFGPRTAGMLAQKGLKLFSESHGSVLQAVVGVRDRSVVYPVLPNASITREQLDRVFRLSRVHENFCVMGSTDWVSLVESALEPRGRLRTVDYDFLVRARQEAPATGSFTLTQARPRDAQKLFPLQEGYEKEEVLFFPEEFQPIVSWMALQKTIREQLVLVAWDGQQPVAMARTNARAGEWAQLGGVYTLPSHRRQGLQKALLVTLMNQLSRQGQGVCLFVKKQNLAALKLYFELGFGDASDFRISYWAR